MTLALPLHQTLRRSRYWRGSTPRHYRSGCRLARCRVFREQQCHSINIRREKPYIPRFIRIRSTDWLQDAIAKLGAELFHRERRDAGHACISRVTGITFPPSCTWAMGFPAISTSDSVTFMLGHCLHVWTRRQPQEPDFRCLTGCLSGYVHKRPHLSLQAKKYFW